MKTPTTNTERVALANLPREALSADDLDLTIIEGIEVAALVFDDYFDIYGDIRSSF